MTEIIKTPRVNGRVDGWTDIGTLRGPRGPKKICWNFFNESAPVSAEQIYISNVIEVL